MTAFIHETAVVSPKAKLGNNVHIGPYCIVGENVTLHDNVHLKAHVFMEGLTEVGENSIIYPFTTLGTPPQDRKAKGEPTRVVIGKNALIREHTSITAGTAGGGGITSIGDNAFIMASVHIGHDCIIGNNVTICSGAGLGGHVIIEDFAYIGGLAGFHQFARVGRYAMIGGAACVLHNVIPYGLVKGNRAFLTNLNIIGLQRMGLDKKEIQTMLSAYKMLFKDTSIPFQSRIECTEETYSHNARIMEIITFIKTPSLKTGMCMPQH